MTFLLLVVDWKIQNRNLNFLCYSILTKKGKFFDCGIKQSHSHSLVISDCGNPMYILQLLKLLANSVAILKANLANELLTQD